MRGSSSVEAEMSVGVPDHVSSSAKASEVRTATGGLDYSLQYAACVEHSEGSRVLFAETMRLPSGAPTECVWRDM